MSEFGYCPHDETPLVEDVKFNDEFKQVAITDGTRQLLSHAMVRCTTCDLSWHASNPHIRTKASEYAKAIAGRPSIIELIIHKLKRIF
jgi:hypothetical protein